MTPDAILDVVRAKAAVHPELAAPLTWDSFRRILAREDVALFTVPMPRPAQLVPVASSWCILVNAKLSARRHLYYATHELGHLWLHHDPACDRWERVYNMDVWEGDDPRESDAELFCTIVLGAVRYF